MLTVSEPALLHRFGFVSVAMLLPVSQHPLSLSDSTGVQGQLCHLHGL